MKDFEQLLEEVLEDVREAEPLAGLEARIMTRVASKAKSGTSWHLTSGAIAAALLAAVLIHAGTHPPDKPLATAPPVLASGVDCLTTHAICLSAEGATYTSLGRRPRDALNKIRRGLKARDIEAPSAIVLRDKSSLSRRPRDASLHISPIIIAPLRMEPIELASLTLKNSTARGEPQ